MLNEDSLDLARNLVWIEHRRLEEISPFGVSVLHHFEANAQTVDEMQTESSTNIHMQTKKPNLICLFFCPQ